MRNHEKNGHDYVYLQKSNFKSISYCNLDRIGVLKIVKMQLFCVKYHSTHDLESRI